jgi:dihydrodipicolinate synthase/N-acetylneuraminate lyase
MAMMPAFTTEDGDQVTATQTVDVGRLEAGVDKLVAAGVDSITTTGSFGETSNLLMNEFDILARATVETVKRRVPVIIGCTGVHTREAVEKIRIAEDAGADGVIVGIPYYFPSTVENAVNFYQEIGSLFPKLGILIYHNPTIHHVTLPVSAFTAISRIKNVVGMKDSHRTPLAFMELMDIVRGKISIFVQQAQYYPYAELGAAGFWSIDVWMGPEPLLLLRDSVAAGDTTTAISIVKEISAHRRGPEPLSWREMGHKIAVRYAGYCDPGPLRPPFSVVPEDIKQRLKARAAHWRELCAKYGPLVAEANARQSA